MSIWQRVWRLVKPWPKMCDECGDVLDVRIVYQGHGSAWWKAVCQADDCDFLAEWRT